MSFIFCYINKLIFFYLIRIRIEGKEGIHNKEQILHLKSQEWTWKRSISEPVKATPAACRKFFQRHQTTADLPPKLRLPKTMIQGSLDLKIKRMVNEKPSIFYRDIEHELKKHTSGDEHVPRWSTIRTFLLS